MYVYIYIYMYTNRVSNKHPLTKTPPRTRVILNEQARVCKFTT